MKFYNFKIAFIVLSCVPFGSYATSLQQAARAALTYDSALQSSQMTSEADQQKYWQGMAGMLPTLTLEGNWDRQEQPDKKYQSGVTNHSYDLSVRQPLFDMSKYAGWRKGVAIANTAEAQSKKAEEKLLNAISNAYFSVLYQQEVLQAAKAASHNFKQQQQKLQAGILNGQNTRTELDEAKANYALAQAKEIEASSQLLLAGEAFRRLSGVSPDTVEPVNFQCLNASPYASLTDAINASQQRNTEIKIALFQNDQADADVLAADGAHMPVVSLYARYGKNWSRNDNDDNLLYDAIFGTNSKSNNLQYGVNVSIPLFAGGSQISQSYEAAYRRQAAKYSTMEAQRKAATDTRSAWLSLTNGKALINAQKNAVESSREKVVSVQYGREMGFRTVNDELDAQQKYFSALKDQAEARFNYLNALINLAQSTGSLSIDMLNFFQCR
ncbi:TolC family outer membrane protein [Pantoea agglomerans]|jgi:outer membrane protein|uniref:TolC family outer membrane protein n=2 Tax=Pantoea TaxID=53335 RepID=A0ACC5PU36_ENTAG|nr:MULTISPECIES: TolC family outer membrane protein [Pantoea]MDF9912465.1 outer membrane protein [Pantoea brenneri]AYP25688.1 transporter [Pantoea agglomerans]AZI53550.1 transporter [Pantoea agglomerans]ERM10279.1 transporter [Pantoea agglomerans Tx10]KAF6629492.1 TolC family outer membrane protein [Pantoea sp. EKM10T]